MKALTNSYNAESENYVLGCILQDNTLMDECFLLPDHFSDVKTKLIFEAIKQLHQKRLPIDIVGLTEELKQHMPMIGIGHFQKLYDSVPSREPFKYYCNNILERWKESKSRELLLQSANHSELNSDERQKIIQQLNDIDEHSTNDEVNLNELLFELHEELYQEKPKGLSGIATGFEALDKLTDGWQAEDFIVIGARPSVGKTAWSLNVALRAGMKDTIVSYFSIEMSAKAMLKRLICIIARVDGMKAKNPYHELSKEEKERYAKATGVISTIKPQIYDASRQTVNYMRSKLRKNMKDHPDKKHLVMIDYLTKIDSPNHHQSNHTKYTEVSADLKAMAKDFKVPVVCLAQLSRGVEQRQNKRPMMSDLRESGSIEQDADIIGFLYREEYQNVEEQDDQLIELNVTKHRNGALGLVEMRFNKPTGRMENK